MNIAIDVSQMAYTGTGVARYVRSLTKALLRAQSPHHFTLIAGAHKQRQFFLDLATTSPWNKASWKLISLPPKIAGLGLNTLPLPYELLVGRYDLLHTSDWVQPATGMPTVTTVHDLVFRKYPGTVDPLIRYTQTKRLERLVKSDTHIVCDSQNTKNDLMEIYHINPGRMTVVYPGKEALFKASRNKDIERVKTKYHIQGDYVMTLGTQEPRKNLDRAVAAWEMVRTDEEMKKLELVIVGRYGWGEKTREPRGCHVTGFVPDADVIPLITGASVFLYPSLYEGFGFPVLEAMACGTPVVTSNLSSLPEVAGHAAILVDPLDVRSITTGIQEAWKDRVKLGTAGPAQAATFTWEKAAKEMMEVYEQTARNRS